MITRRDKIAVAVFVLATFGLLVAFLGVLWGLRAAQPYKRYYVVTESSVAGLTPSAPVKYLGVDVGKVELMEFDDSTPPKVKLTLAVMLDTPVKKDTKAQLTPQGITGIQFIELVRGKEKDALAPGSEIGFLPSTFTDVVTKLEDLAAAAKTLMVDNKDRVANLLETTTVAIASTQNTIDRLATKVEAILDENRGPLKDVVASARTNLDETAKLLGELRERKAVDEMMGALADARRAINDVDLAIRELKQQIGPTVVSDAVADLRSTAHAATDAATTARELVARLGGKVEDDLEATGRALEQLQRTARSLEELSREIKERPALLIRDLERRRREVRDE